MLIHEQGLRGTLPSEIALLTSLTDLHLESNRFYGTIPSEIFQNLPDLLYLNLNTNEFDGTLQLGPGALQSLRSLLMDKNQLKGTLQEDFGDLLSRSLEILDLSHNDFSGTIPPSIINIGQLGFLYLSFNSLDGKSC